MTPAEEVRFIDLWSQGASYAALAAALVIPSGTVASRAATLQRQGKIVKRPRGGAYPTQKAQGRSGGERGPSTVHPAPSTVDPVPSTVSHLQADLTAALTAALQPVLARLEALETGLTPRPHEDRPPSTVHRLPSTVYRPPGHLGIETAQALGPVDRLCAPGHAGGVAATGRRPRAEPQFVGARGPGALASGGGLSDGERGNTPYL
jgi:hypothetical protein